MKNLISISDKVKVMLIILLCFVAYVAIEKHVKFQLLLLLLSCFSHVRLCATPETAARQVPHPWDSPGKNTGVGCYFLLQDHTYMTAKKPVITFDPTENLRIAYEACLNRIR